MKKTRFLVFVLLAALILPVLAGCATGGNGGTVTTAPTGEVTTEGAVTTAEEKPDYPTADFTGKTFTILVSGHTGVNAFNDFAYDASAASVFDDAIYRRNSAVEEQFGITVKTIEDFKSTPDAKSLIIKNHTAGDNLYDAALPIAYDAATLAYSNYLYDLNSLPTLDLTHSWWDQKANEDLTMRGILFFTTGDYGIFANNVTYCITFNKDLAAQYQVGDLYALVQDGNWTFDTMEEATMKVSGDLNANSSRDVYDLYGLTTWDDAIYGVVNAVGTKICSIDDDGILQLTLNTERTSTAIEKYMNLVTNSEYCINFQHTTISVHDDAIMQTFGGGNSLFLMIMFKNLSAFRDSDLNYGILPYPKLDSVQDQYYNTIAPWHVNFVCVPYLIEDEVFSGTILEALCYESRNVITEAYYEKTLVGRTVRDDESVEMLNLIFDTRMFDIGLYYKPGNISAALITELVRKNSSNFSSMYSTYETAAQSNVDKINKFYESALDEWQK